MEQVQGELIVYYLLQYFECYEEIANLDLSHHSKSMVKTYELYQKEVLKCLKERLKGFLEFSTEKKERYWI